MTEQQMKCRIKVILQHFPGNFFRSFFVFPMSDSKFDNIVTIFFFRHFVLVEVEVKACLYSLEHRLYIFLICVKMYL